MTKNVSHIKIQDNMKLCSL